MPKLLHVDLLPEVEAMLMPQSFEPGADDKRIDALLETYGFVVVWEAGLAPKMEELGARVARALPYADGKHWPMMRARCEDGFICLVPGATLVLFQRLHEALRNLEDDFAANDRREPHGATLAMLRNVCRNADFPPERIAALETVARLGSRESVIAYLKADDGGAPW